MTTQSQRQNTCFVCGHENPRGMQLRFEMDPGGSAEAEWVPDSAWEGFRGVIHGGIVSSVLDEAMAKAAAAMRSPAFTGELRVRFRRPVNTGETYRIRGWIVKRERRLLEAEATVTDTGGEECAHGWGRFVVAPQNVG